MFQVKGFSGPQQRPIEDGMGNQRPRTVGIRQIEPPDFDAFIPTGMDKTHVVAGSGRDEQSTLQIAKGALIGAVEIRSFIAAFRKPRMIRQALFDAGDPAVIGFSGPEDGAFAVHHMDVGVIDRFSAIQGRHPYEGGIPPLFEMDGQIGDQGGSRYEHGLGRIEQRFAQNGAFDLHDIQPRFFQGDSHHFELLAAADFRHGKFDGSIGAVEHGFLAGSRCHFSEPELHGIDLIRRQIQLFSRQSGIDHFGWDVGFDIAKGQRQRRVCMQFDDAEPGGEFGQGWIGAGMHLERKPAGVREPPAGVIRHPIGKFEPEIGFFGKRPFEADISLFRIQRFFLDTAVRALQHDIAGKLGRKVCIEFEPERQDRNAAGSLVFPFTVKRGKKGLPYLESKNLIRCCDDPAVHGCHPFAPDQIHFGLFGKPLFALQQQQPVRFGFFQEPGAGLENGFPLLVFDNLDIQPLPDAIDDKPHIGLDGGLRGRCIQGQNEYLIFGDAGGAVERGGFYHRRAAR